MRKVLLLMVLLLSLSGYSQITKIEVEKPLREVYISTLATSVKSYKSFIEVTTQNQEFTKIKDIFSFTISNEDYKSLKTLVNEGKEGDVYHLVGYKGESIKIFFIKVALMNSPLMVMSIGDKTVPYNIFGVNHYKKKFFSLVE